MSDKPYAPMFAVGDRVVRSTDKEGMMRIRGFVNVVTSYSELMEQESLQSTLHKCDELNQAYQELSDWKERPIYIVSPDSMNGIYPPGNSEQHFPVASYEEAQAIVAGITLEQYHSIIGAIPRIFIAPESCLMEIPDAADLDPDKYPDNTDGRC